MLARRPYGDAMPTTGPLPDGELAKRGWPQNATSLPTTQTFLPRGLINGAPISGYDNIDWSSTIDTCANNTFVVPLNGIRVYNSSNCSAPGEWATSTYPNGYSLGSRFEDHLGAY